MTETAVIAAIAGAITFLIHALVPGTSASLGLPEQAALFLACCTLGILWRQLPPFSRNWHTAILLWRPRLLIAGVLCAGLSFTVLATMVAGAQQREAARFNFERLTNALVARTGERVQQTLHGLIAVRSFYAASERVTRAEFGSFVNAHDLPAEYPGAIGMGFIERVRRADLEAFVARERADGCPEFTVHAVPGVVAPPASADELLLIRHCFPRERNARAWGLDIGSESRRRAAAEHAIRTGKAAMTRMISLVQANREKAGFLLLLPIYANESDLSSDAARHQSLLGLAYMPILLEEVVAGIFDAVGGQLDFEIFEGTEPSSQTRMFDHDRHLDGVVGRIEHGNFADRMFQQESRVAIGGQEWTIITSTTPAFEASALSLLAPLLALGGSTMTLLLTGMVWLLSQSQHRARELGDAKTLAEQAARENRTILHALNQHSIVSVADTQGRIVMVNDEFCRISGYSREELLGKDHRVLNSGHHPHSFWTNAWKTIWGGRTWQGEVCNRAKDGTIYWVQTVIAPCLDADGRIQNFISIRNDITSRKQNEIRLLESAELIERKNRDLAALAERAHRVVDDVSHEFRTPLAVIKEFGSIIAEGIAGPVTEQQTRYLKIMGSAVVDLNHMVEDLLDSSKLRAGRLRVDRRSVSVQAILEKGRTALARKASNRCIVMEECVAPGLPDVFCDEEKVRRVISNLMTNAIKFSPENGVIRLAAGWGRQAGEIVISVSDNGPGLSTEDINQLFGRFQQVSTARSVAAKGFGLGLSIAQELTWLNLGRLWVESEKGKGATFFFTLPVAEPIAVLQRHFEAIVRADRPEPWIALLHATAGDGDPAEMHAFLASVTYPTDLVLPGCWNCASTGQPHQHSWWILGRTGSAASWANRIATARAFLETEGNGKLGELRIEQSGTWKCPDEADLAEREVVQRITERMEMKKVLIIDDEWTIQQALQARLLASGFEVLMAGDGQAGIDAAAKHRPDVILLDLRMPDMDGFEVLRHLRAAPESAAIPVVFLTANVQDTVKQQALSAGAAGFLPKPYEAAIVLETIRRATSPQPAGNPQ